MPIESAPSPSRRLTAVLETIMTGAWKGLFVWGGKVPDAGMLQQFAPIGAFHSSQD